MKKIGHLDLNAREGKRPGGYNMPLPLTGVPFVFMNATQSVKDIIILAHESGHAGSFILYQKLQAKYNETPS